MEGRGGGQEKSRADMLTPNPSTGRPSLYHEHDDDARSVSSVASYLDSNPPLTARLPPAVRVRSHAFVGKHRAPPSDRRLSQLEQQLQELEMEDWRTDRLIDSGPHDRLRHAWKPDLPREQGVVRMRGAKSTQRKHGRLYMNPEWQHQGLNSRRRMASAIILNLLTGPGQIQKS